ncbi:ankyrin repeat and LEM domain-containing protein 1 isoform X2 [Hyperolius riggenbachi]|uniref:ankyrin repeat and LEM domain-containing protein 1 isoform X2 n=1 Tax=Hyperolius riggenbachi TaxID=752182 RepID=UPI0035A304F3
MAGLAQKLCEAVENEDAEEVENLLNCGADPNLVLPNGIAPIHLASGKESESALRCLTLILQHSGNPNVRSIEELTPLHVASSWGCCKALIFLLQKGGDPNIQDQDGNTALDLALIEKNRRCVVALQEFADRRDDGYLEQNHSYFKNDSYLPEDIPEISSIPLLESTCEMSPFHSTKIFPFISNHRNGTSGKGVDDAILVSQTEGTDNNDAKVRSESIEQEIKSSIEQEMNGLLLNTKEKTSTVTSDSKTECLETLCATLTSQTNQCKKNCSDRRHPDSTNRLPIENKGSFNIPNVSGNLCSWDSEHSGIQSKGTRALRTHSGHENLKIIDDPLIGSTQSRILHSWESLDVTSPDHVYTYSRGHSQSNLENTLVLPDTGDIDVYLGEATSSSKYTSCSEGFASLEESCFSGEKSRLVTDDFKAMLDSNSNQICNLHRDIAEVAANTDTCSMQDLCDTQHIVHGLQDKKNMNDKELEGAINLLINKKCLDSSSKYVGDQEGKTLKAAEMLQASITLPTSSIALSEGDAQDYRILKDNLMVSNNCPIDVEGKHSTQICSDPGVKPLCSDTLPVVSEKNISTDYSKVINQHLKNAYLQCLNNSADTLIVDSTDLEAKERLDSELLDEFKKMMLATKTKNLNSVQNEENSPCFITPRTKSRIQSSKCRHSNSSLFDESVEMPQRGRRLRSPDSLTASPGHSDMHARHKSYTVQEHSHSSKKDSDCETTVNISSYLTDDLTENEFKPKPQLKGISGAPCFENMNSESMWITEDGDTESSGEAASKPIASTVTQGTLHSHLCNASFFHSTLREHNAANCAKPPRYSFSRLSCGSKLDETGINLCQQNTITDCDNQEVPLSPGGRPVNVSQFEPVEYLYMDNEKGHFLIERHVPSTDPSSSSIVDSSDETVLYDWRDYRSAKQKPSKDATCSPNQVAVELYRLSNAEIARRLMELGENPGQVTSKTRKVCILLLDKCLKEQAATGLGGLSFEYSPELSLALRTYNIPESSSDEVALSQEFDQPDKTKKWREGVLKSSFNYLLLDPRVTRNLPSRSHTISQLDCFRTFIRAVFYVGKGKRARPYCHLYEALTFFKDSSKQNPMQFKTTRECGICQKRLAPSYPKPLCNAFILQVVKHAGQSPGSHTS